MSGVLVWLAPRERIDVLRPPACPPARAPTHAPTHHPSSPLSPLPNPPLWPADEEEEAKPKTKTVKEQVKEWVALNANQALWLRPPGNVSDEEYNKFYQALAKVGA